MQVESATAAVRPADNACALFVRWVVSFHLAVLLLQLSTAVGFVAGWAGAIAPHAMNGWIVGTAGMVQAILIWRLRSARRRPVVRGIALAIPCVEVLQIYLGLGQGIGLHVTVAMIVWALALALFIQVWAPAWKHAEN
jgi:hypothetical protein